MKNNILVTGCAGFIASHLIEELLKNSSLNIIGIDSFYSGTVDNIKYLKSLDINNNFHFIENDIRNFDQIDKTIKSYQIKKIYHLASLVSVQESINNPLLSHDVNVKGTLNILESARINNVQRIVFSSSAAVYGNEKALPQNENSPVSPISPYGCDKLIGEYYMKLYSELYGIETISLRYFNVYGPRQSIANNYSGVISNFDNKIKKNEIPFIYGTGEQYRDFINVKDVVTINIKAMQLENISHELFCVGTGIKTTINNIFQTINKKYQKSLLPQYEESKNGDILESVCDNKKLINKLKIKSLKSFKEGIFEL